MKIAIINGPNLNLLGKREPDIYGNESMDKIIENLRNEYPSVDFTYFQSNNEGVLIDKIQEIGFVFDGIVLNAGGYTHTSVALADAVSAIKTKVVEVHISNIFAREEFRHKSYLSPVCCGTITGFGISVYSLAVKALLINLQP